MITLVFCRALDEEAQGIYNSFGKYQVVSGQLINYQNSTMVFSSRVQEADKNEINKWMTILRNERMRSYLGIHTQVGTSKNHEIQFIMDHIRKRITWWKEKHLFYAGKKVLTKAIIQAISNYVMSVLKVPMKVCKDM